MPVRRCKSNGKWRIGTGPLDWTELFPQAASKPVEGTALEEDVEFDVVVMLPPVERWTTQIRVTSVRKR